MQRVTLTKAEIESAERHRDLLSEVHAENQDALATAESHLELLMQIFDQRDLQDIKDDVAYYHAVFADELVALTIADAQVEQMDEVIDEEGSSLGQESDRDSGTSSMSEFGDGAIDEKPFTGLLSSSDDVFD